MKWIWQSWDQGLQTNNGVASIQKPSISRGSMRVAVQVETDGLQVWGSILQPTCCPQFEVWFSGFQK